MALPPAAGWYVHLVARSARRLLPNSTLRVITAWLLASSLALGLVAIVPAQAVEDTATIIGRGYGHGRGMGQWGAYGYAVDRSWDYRRILDHFYGGTRLAFDAGNPTIDVLLTGWNGRDTIVVGPGITVNGSLVGAPAVLVRRLGSNAFQLFTGPGCAGPWTAWGDRLPSGVRVDTTGDERDPATLPKLCEAGQVRGYRGQFVVIDRGSDQATLNRVDMNNYLRGVIPRESPAAWGSAGGGRGMDALKAQAIAARSFALARRFAPYAQTCDTTACQVYSGALTQPFGGAIALLEDSRTDRAATETSGQVRRTGTGAVALAEFSASTGGWTAGGQFPAVEDQGDGTAANPHRTWKVELPLTELARRLGTGPLRDVRVTSRNGLGADGGRALSVTIVASDRTFSLTGAQFRNRVGLKSDWFVISLVSSAAARSYLTALYSDVLDRVPDSAGLSAWLDSVLRGTPRSSIARAFVYSTEHLNALVNDLYRGALQRGAESRGANGWVSYIRSGKTWNDAASRIYGSPESLSTLGAGDTKKWVEGVYQAVLGRSAEPGATTRWASIASARGRVFVAQQILISTEARARRLNGYYQQYLQRSVDPAGARSYTSSLASNGDLDVPSALASSQEYWNKAISRFPN